MTRQDHWHRAQELLAEVEGRARATPTATLRSPHDALMLAQVHATLAAAPPDVAGEEPLEEYRVLNLGPGQVVPVDDLRERLEAALVELEGLGATLQESRRVARMIRGRVLDWKADQ